MSPPHSSRTYPFAGQNATSPPLSSPDAMSISPAIPPAAAVAAAPDPKARPLSTSLDGAPIGSTANAMMRVASGYSHAEATAQFDDDSALSSTRSSFPSGFTDPAAATQLHTHLQNGQSQRPPAGQSQPPPAGVPMTRASSYESAMGPSYMAAHTKPRSSPTNPRDYALAMSQHLQAQGAHSIAQSRGWQLDWASEATIPSVGAVLGSQTSMQALTPGGGGRPGASAPPAAAAAAAATSLHPPPAARSRQDPAVLAAQAQATAAQASYGQQGSTDDLLFASASHAAAAASLPLPSRNDPSLAYAARDAQAQAAARAQAQMTEIATRAAKEEGEAQSKTLAHLKAGGRVATPSSSSVASSPAFLNVRENSSPAPSISVTVDHRPEASGDGADAAAAGRKERGRPRKSSLGLSSIPLPSFSLSGVPSMPLMPTPPLQMLPPPPSPSLTGSGTPPPGGRHLPSWRVGGGMAGLPYPFQVVQTPGGTARAEWWVPREARERLRAGSTNNMDMAGDRPPAVLPQEPSAENSKAYTYPPPDLHRGPPSPTAVRHSFASDAPGAYTLDDQYTLTHFEPIYHTFSPAEYAALASAAAYATAALTSTSSADIAAGDKKSTIVVPPSSARQASEPSSTTAGAAGWRPLDGALQNAIAGQLRAWAGLEGPEKQAEARQQLERRQERIKEGIVSGAAISDDKDPKRSSHRAHDGVHTDVSALKAHTVPSSPRTALQTADPTSFFPPDFASHYRAQLRALTEGYYTQLHREGLAGGQWATGSSADTTASSPSATLGRTGPSPPAHVVVSRANQRAGLGGPRTSSALSSTSLVGTSLGEGLATHQSFEPHRQQAPPPLPMTSVQASRLSSHQTQQAMTAGYSTGESLAAAARQQLHLQQQQHHHHHHHHHHQHFQPQGIDPSQAATDGVGMFDPSVAQGQAQVQVQSQAQSSQVFPAAILQQQQAVHASAAAATPAIAGLPQTPLQLLSAASNAAGVSVTAPEVRDQLLQYAHTLYSIGAQAAATQQSQRQGQGQGQQGAGDAGTSPTKQGQGQAKLHPTLLPLLHTLHNLHPNHLPTLLLLSCAYYTSGNLASSLWYNNLILRIDPNYVEAMSNIGTTLRALGRWQEAESWWWKAIKLRPGYFDALDNLVGVLCSPTPPPVVSGAGDVTKVQQAQQQQQQQQPTPSGPRYVEALQLCEFVERHLVGPPATLASLNGAQHHQQQLRPLPLPPHVPTNQSSRLQNLFYAKGNLKYVLPDAGVVPAADEYEKAIEIVLSANAQEAYDLRDVVVATCVVSFLCLGASVPGYVPAVGASQILVALGVNPNNASEMSMVTAGMFSALRPGGLLRMVRDAGGVLIQTLLRLGGGVLPTAMLLPEHAMQATKYIFADTDGTLPAMARHVQAATASAQAIQQASQTTSTIMLTLAKLYQDATASPAGGPHGPLTLGGLPPSTSLLLPLYYISVALHPSASTCNNLGILLSSIPVVTTVLNNMGQRQQLNGQALAMQWYTYGLQLDPAHAHLYTNLGSLLKDLGHLNEAVRMYEKAIECNPRFDVALANLGNAIKDMGRTQDSVQYYRRAVQVNPRFPEALCGLVNALLAVCDWREVYAERPGERGWMDNVSELVTKQLDEGLLYGAGVIQSEGRPEDWLQLVLSALGTTSPVAKAVWQKRIRPFYTNLDRVGSKINEGGFVIRLIERMLRRMQRRWYVDTYGKVTRASAVAGMLPVIRPTPELAAVYRRIPLPPCLVTPSVPTVLPFHTFTYPLSPRQIRLISHRNALRISQTTLSQMWLPQHVYPPPPPPQPKINIGYVSSDFNNHPLAHLMQSVFGFHDRSRFNVFLYATTASDQSPYRQKIEREAQHFLDVSTWSNQRIVERVVQDGIHILMNLNGYTKGARNEVFAARPCPVQMEFMGFAGTLASGWTDWVVADPIVCPPEVTSGEKWRAYHGLNRGHTYLQNEAAREDRETDLEGDLDPEDPLDDWVYTEKFIYMPHSYFVNDHRQGFRDEAAEETGVNGLMKPPNSAVALTPQAYYAAEEEKRWKMRRELFPNLPDDFVIFTNFNQLYKIEPMLFKLWLRILARVPRSIIWLLRFPATGEPHLLRAAREWAGEEVASRVVFTDVAPKHIHIHRGRIADLFLDTTECNAHTTAADILWSGTPILTWPRHKHKMCSRVAASIAKATGYGAEMIVESEREYEDRAVELARTLWYEYLDTQGTVIGSVGGTATEHNVASAAIANGGAAGAQVAAHTVRRVPPAQATSRRGMGPLADLRRNLFMTRDHSPLFDTLRWTRNLERGYEEAWRRWVEGTEFEESGAWQQGGAAAAETRSGCIWVEDVGELPRGGPVSASAAASASNSNPAGSIAKAASQGPFPTAIQFDEVLAR